MLEAGAIAPLKGQWGIQGLTRSPGGPKIFRDWRKSLQNPSLGGFGENLVYPKCLIDSDSTNLEDSFYIKLVAMALSPIAIFVINTLFWSLIACCSTKIRKNGI